MQKRWVLSTFFRDENNMLRPVATAYGGHWRCPMYPKTDDGAALVEIYSAVHQLEAAKQDPRIEVLSLYSPLPQVVIDAYKDYGATSGMTLGQILDLLSEVEPIYAEPWT